MNHFLLARFAAVAIACLAVATCFATRSQADTPAILTGTNNGASVTNSSIVGNFDVNIGWSFTVGATPITLTQLGFYDFGADGLTSSHQVGIWTNGGETLLAQTTIQAGTASPLLGDYRYEIVAPIGLAANTAYVLGALSPASSTDRFIYSTKQTYDSRITYGTSRIGSSETPGTGTLRYPGSSTLGNQGYFGPTFQSISAINVPEASTLAFTLPTLGMVALCNLGKTRHLYRVGAVVLRRRKK